MSTPHELGRRGEDAAARHLESTGWTVVARNWRCVGGEIDLIVRRDGVVAFVEVRTQSTRSRSVVRPEATVGAAKQARLEHAASVWLAANPPEDAVFRFDVMAVVLSQDGGAEELRHYEDAFRPRTLIL